MQNEIRLSSDSTTNQLRTRFMGGNNPVIMDPSRAINTVVEELDQSEDSQSMMIQETAVISGRNHFSPYYQEDNMFLDLDALERRALQRNGKLLDIERLLNREAAPSLLDGVDTHEREDAHIVKMSKSMNQQ